MSKPSRTDIVSALLDRHGQPLSAELGIRLSQNTPSPLFRWLCASLPMSARISAGIAVDAARALAEAGWTTPRKMAGATWAERTRVLNRSGYARYDESTSRMLGDSCDLLLNRYGGDLRRLREEAAREPKAERRLIKQFKGVGDVGADIFFREVQGVWDELYPFADKRALNAAKRLGVGEDPKSLSKLVERKDFVPLVAALVRVDLEDDFGDVRKAAA